MNEFQISDGNHATASLISSKCLFDFLVLDVSMKYNSRNLTYKLRNTDPLAFDGNSSQKLGTEQLNIKYRTPKQFYAVY